MGANKAQGITKQIWRCFIGFRYTTSSVTIDINILIYGRIEDDSVAVWSAREDRIIMVIVNHFLRDKDFILAIKLYNKVLNKKPKDVNLLSGLGRIFLQMGNVRAAEVVFNQVEQLTQSTDSSTLVHINR